MIARFTKNSQRWSALALILLTALGVATLTGAKSQNETATVLLNMQNLFEKSAVESPLLDKEGLGEVGGTEETKLLARNEEKPKQKAQDEATPLQSVTTRVFPVAPGIFNATIESTGGAGGGAFTPLGTTTKTGKADVKKAFEQFGIEFPVGTSVYYQESLGVLIAAHFPKVLDQIEQIVLRLGRVPPQISFEIRLIDMPKETVENLLKEQMQSKDAAPIRENILKQIEELEKQKKATLLSTVKSTTTSGETAK